MNHEYLEGFLDGYETERERIIQLLGEMSSAEFGIYDELDSEDNFEDSPVDLSIDPAKGDAPIHLTADLMAELQALNAKKNQ